jgi:excisionase family DNA binding protein
LIIPDDIAEKMIGLKDQYFDLRGLSQYSALAVSTIRAHLRRGNLPSYKVGGKILIKRSHFDRWMERHRNDKGRDLERVAAEALESLKKQ